MKRIGYICGCGIGFFKGFIKGARIVYKIKNYKIPFWVFATLFVIAFPVTVITLVIRSLVTPKIVNEVMDRALEEIKKYDEEA